MGGRVQGSSEHLSNVYLLDYFQLVKRFLTTVEPRFNEVKKGLGQLVRYIEGSFYQKPRYNEFVGKQPKCSLYRGILNN